MRRWWPASPGLPRSLTARWVLPILSPQTTTQRGLAHFLFTITSLSRTARYFGSRQTEPPRWRAQQASLKEQSPFLAARENLRAQREMVQLRALDLSLLLPVLIFIMTSLS